jgi:hypothetical protein
MNDHARSNSRALVLHAIPGGAARLPANLAPGSYRLSLFLPDADETLRTRPEYAIQFANTGVWDESEGSNQLGNLAISSDGPGATDPNAGDALEIVP